MAIRYQNFIVSTIVAAAILGIVVYTKSEATYFLTIVGTIGLWIAAGLMMVLRFASFISREGFGYIFIGTANFSLGLLSIYLYLIGKVNEGLPQFMCVNLLLGLVLLLDGLILKRKPYEVV